MCGTPWAVRMISTCRQSSRPGVCAYNDRAKRGTARLALNIERLDTGRLLPAGDQLCDRLELHIGRALVDRADLGVAPEFLDRVVLDVAVAAIKLDRFGRNVLGAAGGIELGDRCLF